jgi:hypothetical protein
MKRQLVLIFILSCTSFLASGQQTIEGKWILNIDKSIEGMETSEYTKYDTLPSSAKARATESMRGREFQFGQEGQLVVNWNVKGVEMRTVGRWAVDKRANMVTLLVDDVKYEYLFEQPAQTVLILKSVEPSGYFNTLYFTKSTN